MRQARDFDEAISLKDEKGGDAYRVQVAESLGVRIGCIQNDI